MKASWGVLEKDVESLEELVEICEAIRASGEPTMLFLEADSGRTFVFGIGQGESVLTFWEPDGTSFHSLGDAARRGHLRFLCRDQADEYLAEMAVPEQAALTAAAQFLATGDRPSAVTWEPDW